MERKVKRKIVFKIECENRQEIKLKEKKKNYHIKHLYNGKNSQFIL